MLFCKVTAPSGRVYEFHAQNSTNFIKLIFGEPTDDLNQMDLGWLVNGIQERLADKARTLQCSVHGQFPDKTSVERPSKTAIVIATTRGCCHETIGPLERQVATVAKGLESL